VGRFAGRGAGKYYPLLMDADRGLKALDASRGRLWGAFPRPPDKPYKGRAGKVGPGFPKATPDKTYKASARKSGDHFSVRPG